MDSTIQRKNMVDSQVRPNDVTDRRIPRAMLAVPRELFVPEERRSIAYMDGDLPLESGGEGRGRVLLAPRSLAKLLQALAIGEQARVLDIGCATGYSAAILAHMADRVVGLESDEGLAAKAREIVGQLGLTNCDIESGSLIEGLAGKGPYDAIFVGGRIAEMPRGLLDQLKDGGRLVAILDQNGVGKASLWQRYGTNWDRRVLFDVEAPLLPGFERKAAFVF